MASASRLSSVSVCLCLWPRGERREACIPSPHDIVLWSNLAHPAPPDTARVSPTGCSTAISNGSIAPGHCTTSSTHCVLGLRPPVLGLVEHGCLAAATARIQHLRVRLRVQDLLHPRRRELRQESLSSCMARRAFQPSLSHFSPWTEAEPEVAAFGAPLRPELAGDEKVPGGVELGEGVCEVGLGAAFALQLGVLANLALANAASVGFARSERRRRHLQQQTPRPVLLPARKREVRQPLHLGRHEHADRLDVV
mmetsp:Transcript_815/g.1927  ORF Transcript_815/g.1927 Transcript_815/m.1927 type:complete len:253 (-) Transcript_815:503-1261(-)